MHVPSFTFHCAFISFYFPFMFLSLVFMSINFPLIFLSFHSIHVLSFPSQSYANGSIYLSIYLSIYGLARQPSATNGYR